MIQQPRTPPTGQRQAVEVHIKWREVLDYKRDLLRMLSIGTGWSVDKLDQVREDQRPVASRASSGCDLQRFHKQQAIYAQEIFILFLILV